MDECLPVSVSQPLTYVGPDAGLALCEEGTPALERTGTAERADVRTQDSCGLATLSEAQERQGAASFHEGCEQRARFVVRLWAADALISLGARIQS